MTQRSPGLPAPSQVTELLDAEFARAGYEVENVTVDAAQHPPRITVVADGDTPLDMATVADLSRTASQLLDGLPDLTAAYILEVTSPGVDRPLTQEKHFRRAHARLVQLELSDGSTLSGRLGGVDDGVVNVVVRERSDWSVRSIKLDDIVRAVVQVEFSSPSKRELELVGRTGREASG